MTSQQTLLVVGGAGYIGSTVAFRALRATNFRVIVFDKLMYPGSSIYPFFALEDRFEFVHGDCRQSLEAWVSLLREKRVDFVFNAAALVGEHICKKYPEDALQINQEASITIAEACAAAGEGGGVGL
jgi:nucleoside-diphosphate-sugar epimerase